MNDITCLKTLRGVMQPDLDLLDIKTPLVEHNGVFSNEEFQDIVAEPDELLRLDLMFNVLESKKHHDANVVQRFVQSLYPYYDWIADQWKQNVAKEDSVDYKSYCSYRNEFSMPRPNSISVYRKELRWTIHKHLMSLQHGASKHRYLFVYGQMGTGKQTLVSQACEDFTIVRHMGYKIFYLDLADTETDVAIQEKLENLMVQLGESFRPDDRGVQCHFTSNVIDASKRSLTRLFEKLFPDSLLVLAHVRHPRLVRYFDFKCKTVIMTDNRDVMHEVGETERFLMEMPKGFSEAECLELFGRTLTTKDSLLPAAATELCRVSQGNPFLIELIRKQLSEKRHSEPAIDWRKLIDDLETCSIKSDKISRMVEYTLKQFTEEEQQRFRDLVIFRDNVLLSLSVLEMYWDLSRNATECFLSKLERCGLLEKRVYKQELFYMLQYFCYNEIKHLHGTDKVQPLHRRLLNRYSIREKLDHRRELELTNEFPNDGYFYRNIGYHIEQAAEYELFARLYQDFGFLEQKLRIVGLTNTVGDLRKYQDHIFRDVWDRQELVESLVDFLIEAECLLSENARLLQLALSSTDEIVRMAGGQADSYKTRVWFRDLAHSLGSSVVRVSNRPLKVRFYASDYVIVSLASNDIELWNISLEHPVKPMVFKDCVVRDIQRTHHFVVALNRRGQIKVWSTRNLPERATYRETESAIRRDAEKTLSVEGGFSCFHALDAAGGRTELLAVSDEGELHIYKAHTPVFRTERVDIKFKTSICRPYLLLPLKQRERNRSEISVHQCLFLAIEASGPVGYIYNMICTSKVARFDEPVALNAFYLYAFNLDWLVFVNVRQIRLRTIQTIDREEPQIVYEAKDGDITCGELTSDEQYIVLGTHRGISIVRIWEWQEVRRVHLNHSIVHLDLIPCQSTTTRQLIAFISHDTGNTVNLYDLELEPGIQVASSQQYKLEGTTVFLANLDEPEPVLLRTIDRLYTLQKLKLVTDSANELEPLPPETFKHELLDAPVNFLVQTRSTSAYYLGLANGKLLRLAGWQKEAEMRQLDDLDTDIILLEEFHVANGAPAEVLVVAGIGICKVYVNEVERTVLADTVRQCYLLYDRFLLTISYRCSVQIYDLVTQSWYLVADPENDTERCYGASAYQAQPRSELILCTADGIVYRLGLQRAEVEEKQLIPVEELLMVKPLDNHSRWQVHCCALSHDGEFLALGCSDGRIVLHMLEQNRQLKELQSHQGPVATLYFNNCSEPGSAHVLVSVGDEIVFWNVDYLYNNQPRKSTGARLSGRFGSRKNATANDLSGENRRSFIGASGSANHSGHSSPIVGSPAQRSFLGEMFGEGSSYWHDKLGSLEKPHLLACIKLNGRANRLIINRDFTKFLTMDEEGYIHYLRPFESPPRQMLLSPPRGSNGGTFTYI